MTLNKALLGLAFGLALSACTPSTTAPTTEASGSTSTADARLTQAKALVAGASKGAVQAEKTFDGPSGVVGVVISQNGNNKNIVWMSADGKALFPQAVSDTGANLNDEAMTAQGLRAKPEDLLTRAAAPGTRSILQGKSGPIATVFMDPNCVFCHKLFVDVQPLVKAGKLRVRYVMVGFLKESSIPKAATILASKDPLATLTKDETAFNGPKEEGGITADKTPDAEALAVVQSNTQLLGETGQISTPVVLFCDKTSGKPSLSRGMPQNLEAFADGMTSSGHPACNL